MVDGKNKQAQASVSKVCCYCCSKKKLNASPVNGTVKNLCTKRGPLALKCFLRQVSSKIEAGVGAGVGPYTGESTISTA